MSWYGSECQVSSVDLGNTGEGLDLQLVHRDAAIDHRHQTLLVQLLVMGENLKNRAQSTMQDWDLCCINGRPKVDLPGLCGYNAPQFYTKTVEQYVECNTDTQCF